MFRNMWRSLICALLPLLIASPVVADELTDLKARLHAIEAENARLREIWMPS